MLLLVVPVVSQFLLVGIVYLDKGNERVLIGIFGVAAIVLIGFLAYGWGRKIKAVPATFGRRYTVMFLALIYALSIYALIIYMDKYHADSYRWIYGLISYLPIAATFAFVLDKLLALPDYPRVTLFFWGLIIFAYVGCVVFYFMAFVQGLRHQGLAKSSNRGWLVYAIVLIGLLGVCGWKFYAEQKNLISTSTSQLDAVTGRKETYDYWPNNDASTLTPIRGETSLLITENYPKLDSATAFYPIVASAVYKIYNHAYIPYWELRDMVRSSRTPYAYEKLINGEVDFIFALQPSDAQIAAAREKGLELEFTPIGKEAFVFLVNAQNPVTSLTIEQVRGIYSGKINNWKDVGGQNIRIMPFQRSQGSGSQTAMEKQVMQGLPFRDALEEEFSHEMGGVYRGVANYRNAQSAIGYSFRYYSTEMQKGGSIRLLAINGIEPTPENIRNGRYPFISDFYIVSARPLSKNAMQLRDWFLSDQGQALIQDVGYIPIREQPRLTPEITIIKENKSR